MLSVSGSTPNKATLRQGIASSPKKGGFAAGGAASIRRHQSGFGGNFAPQRRSSLRHISKGRRRWRVLRLIVRFAMKMMIGPRKSNRLPPTLKLQTERYYFKFTHEAPVVDLESLRARIVAMGQQVTDAECEALFGAVRHREGCVMTLQQFEGIVGRLHSRFLRSQYSDTAQAFESLGGTEDGTVTVGTLRSVIKTFDLPADNLFAAHSHHSNNSTSGFGDQDAPEDASRKIDYSAFVQAVGTTQPSNPSATGGLQRRGSIRHSSNTTTSRAASPNNRGGVDITVGAPDPSDGGLLSLDSDGDMSRTESDIDDVELDRFGVGEGSANVFGSSFAGPLDIQQRLDNMTKYGKDAHAQAKTHRRHGKIKTLLQPPLPHGEWRPKKGAMQMHYKETPFPAFVVDAQKRRVEQQAASKISTQLQHHHQSRPSSAKPHHSGSVAIVNEEFQPKSTCRPSSAALQGRANSTFSAYGKRLSQDPMDPVAAPSGDDLIIPPALHSAQKSLQGQVSQRDGWKPNLSTRLSSALSRGSPTADRASVVPKPTQGALKLPVRRTIDQYAGTPTFRLTEEQRRRVYKKTYNTPQTGMMSETVGAACSVLSVLNKLREGDIIAEAYEKNCSATHGGHPGTGVRNAKYFEVEASINGRFSPTAVNAKRRWSPSAEW